MISSTDMEVCEDGMIQDSEVEDGELVEEENDKSHSEGDKLTQRAKRFGLTETNSKPQINPKLRNLHISMGVDKNTRTEAIHLYGTDAMKTHDVFAYFNKYEPASIEWISDKTCNVVWLDEESCAEAMKNLSVQIKGQNVIEANVSDEEEEFVHVDDIRCALPPGIWRKGHSHSLAPSLFMRFATPSDKKVFKHSNPIDIPYNRNIFLDEGDEVSRKPRQDSSNPWSDIARHWRNFESRTVRKKTGFINTLALSTQCQTQGMMNYDASRMASGPWTDDGLNNAAAPPVQDARDLIRNKDVKRQKTLAERLIRSELEVESKSVPKYIQSPIGKMQADIEEKKIMERNKLRANIRPSKSEPDLRDRLGRKRKRDEVIFEDTESEWNDDVEKDLSLRIEIDNSADYSDQEWEDDKSDHSSDSDEIATRPNTADLRTKLEKKKSSQKKHNVCSKSVLRTRYMNHSRKGSSFSPLRIEIDNDVCNNRSDEE